MNPEEDLKEVDVTTAVSSLMQELPKPVQDFLVSDERGQVVTELSKKYNLHVDQAGEFERAFLFMLLGILKPEDFVSTLLGMGLDQESVNNLAADVNTRVFMRLRDAEREQATAAPSKPAPLPPPALDYQPAVAPTLPGSPVAAPMPTQPAPVTPQAVIPQQHFVHSMPNAQPQSGWHPAAAVHIFVPTHNAPQHQAAPVQQVQEVVPTYSQVPEPVPATPTEQQVPQYTAPPVVPVPAPTPIKKEFGSDPYREPIQ